MKTQSNLNLLEDFVSVSYEAARDKFRAHASALNCELKSIENPTQHGLTGERLYCDIAFFGNDKADHTIAISSGTHGVEGYCGSALQSLLMDRILPSLDVSNLQVILIHAINPFGFSHGTRNNEDNVDINRNFVEFKSQKNGSLASHKLDQNNAFNTFQSTVYPAGWLGSKLQDVIENVDAYIEKHGIQQFQSMMTQGQYLSPIDPYFGGNEETWSNKTWHEICNKHLKNRKNVLHIDLHTGLGLKGTCEVIYTGPLDTNQLSKAQCIFPNDPVIAPGAENSVSPPISGALASALIEHNPNAICTALEFGTVPTEQVLKALIATNWLYSNPRCDSDVKKTILAQLRSAFLIEETTWVEQIWQITERHFLHATKTTSN